MNVLYCNKEVYPQIDDPFQCIDIYNRKALVALWVHPFRVVHNQSFEGRCQNLPLRATNPSGRYWWTMSVISMASHKAICLLRQITIYTWVYRQSRQFCKTSAEATNYVKVFCETKWNFWVIEIEFWHPPALIIYSWMVHCVILMMIESDCLFNWGIFRILDRDIHIYHKTYKDISINSKFDHDVTLDEHLANYFELQQYFIISFITFKCCCCSMKI